MSVIDVELLGLLDQVELPGAQRIPRIVPVAVPAAGAEWSQAVPGGVTWELQTLCVTFTTSNQVANRLPILQLNGDGKLLYESPSNAVQAASLAVVYSWAPRSGANGGTVALLHFEMIFADVPLLPSWTLGSNTLAIQTNDQWSAINLYVIEHRPPAPGSTFLP